MIERKLGFIGAGLMAEALLNGVLEAGVAQEDRLFVADPDPDRRELFARRIGENVFARNLELARRCDVIVLSVKPHVVPAVAEEVRDETGPGTLIVSIAAGVTLSALEGLFGTDRVIRVMPNTPALVGAGAAAYCTGAGATPEDADLTAELLGAVGLCVCVEEKHMDAVTGLSGSGPAYIYMAIEALSDGGVRMGLPRREATRLAAQTVLGAAKMVLQTERHPGELKDQVTTPGGTTIEAVRVLEKAGLRRAFIDAVAAATEKSRALGED